MESTDKHTTASTPASEAAPLQPVADAARYSPLDVVLRVLLFAASLSAVVVMVTSKQSEMVPVPGLPPNIRVPFSAKFNHSPAFIYFVAALSLTGLYSIITTVASILASRKTKSILLLFALLDVVFVGIVASATGAAGAVAYIGLRGNNHVRWNKICNTFDTFCRNIGSAVALSLFAAILLVLLSMTSTSTLYRKIR
ncbi:CASP-like protein 1D1 [Hibiscus syriacus]|uniref:CASP-like protein n=1 Tax=Hibiscus syriacus TaxID=106335 RepID=A0A6A3CQU7_HIBSY|nr:CASP-like protein 1D1 [Hibiscus syriacus]KAE8731563.1 CASP-like protein 1D1 [Hibiscus syriacus]